MIDVEIHFVNVGKGSCTIINHGDRSSIIDIDNYDLQTTDRDLTDPIKYFQTKTDHDHVFRFILTHPDMDHMTGLKELNDDYNIWNFWDVDNNKVITEWPRYNEEDWKTYQSFKDSESDPKYLQLYRDAKADCCWIKDGFRILSPTKSLVKKANESKDYHHSSYVLMLEHNDVKILFGGEASIEAWNDIYEKYGDYLKCDVFLAPHHGSESNVNEDVFNTIEPDFVVVSVAWGIEYDYNYYNSIASKQVLTTKTRGNIYLNTETEKISYDRQ